DLRQPLFTAHFTEHVFSDIDGYLGGNRQGNGVAGPAVHLDQLPIKADAQLGKIGVVAQLADEDVLQFAAHVIDDAGHQVVSQRPGRRHALDAPVDAGGLEDDDDDGKAPVAFHFFQHDYLLIVDLADDDPFQFHLDRHGSLTFRWRSCTVPAAKDTCPEEKPWQGVWITAPRIIGDWCKIG